MQDLFINIVIMMIAIKLIGALALLIYGMKVMSEALQKMAGSQLRHVLAAVTGNRLTGILTGTLITATVQSSSATTVMTVSFVNAGLLTLAQAITVIMGANIGTTLTAWIMTLGYNMDLTTLVFPAFVVGILLIYTRRHRYTGDALFGLAFMFFSLVLLSTTGQEMDLAHNPDVVEFFRSLNTKSHLTILTFLGIGTLVTCIVQSSAAVMALTILLCSTGVLPIHLGIALVMGENIGTTATANLAALGANTQARRAAMAHLVFNVFGVIWILCVFYPFVSLVCLLSGYHEGDSADKLPVVLAMFHTCFNVTNTLILMWFIPQIECLVQWIIRPRTQTSDDEFRLKHIQGGLLKTPEIAVLEAQKEIVHFGNRIVRMVGYVSDAVEATDIKTQNSLLERIEKYETICDNMEMEIANFLEQTGNAHVSDRTKQTIRSMLREISEMESIGDSCFNMARTLRRKQDMNELFIESQKGCVRLMLQEATHAVTNMTEALEQPRDEALLVRATATEQRLGQLRDHMMKDNREQVNNNVYSYASGTLFMDLVCECERLGDYVMNVMEARYEK
jgi:phosphate:Na+ symporter